MNYIVQAVILVYFVGMFALGILGEQRTKNTADYYVAGRQVNGFCRNCIYHQPGQRRGPGRLGQSDLAMGSLLYLCRQRCHRGYLSLLVAAGAQTLYLLPVISIFSLSRIFWKNALKAAPPVSLLRCLSLPFPSRCW